MNERYDMDERLRRAVDGLPESVEPPRDLWPGIAARLDAGDADDAQPARPKRRGFNPWYVAWPVAAALAALFVASPVIWRHEVDTIYLDELTHGYDLISDATHSDLVADDNALSDDDRAVLARNLSLIDDAVEETRDALDRVTRAPGQALNLTAGFQKKIELLERLAGRAARS